MNTIIMLALLKALTQEVNLLELQLAQLETSSSAVVATTTPIVFPTDIVTPTPTVATSTQTVQSAPLLGSVSSTCSIIATNVGSANSPETYIQWTLNGLPTSTMGHVQAVRINVDPLGYNPQTHQFNPIATSTDNWNEQEWQFGAFPNQSTDLHVGWYQSIIADFDGTICSVNPYWN